MCKYQLRPTPSEAEPINYWSRDDLQTYRSLLRCLVSALENTKKESCKDCIYEQREAGNKIAKNWK